MREYKINRDSIKHLLETPPCVGVDITETPMTFVQNAAKIFSERKHEYIMECIVNANIDPDALIKTAKKNQELMEELAELYKKIEDGTLVELPCKVGQTVYCVWQRIDFATEDPPFIKESTVASFILDEGEAKVIPEDYAKMQDCWHWLLSVHLTIKEAEKALKERSENGK